MDLKTIKTLLDKYYQGETTLEEEKILKEYFNQDSEQFENIEEKKAFNYFNSQKSKIPEDLNKLLIDTIENESKKNNKTRKIIYWAGSIAAALIIGILFVVLTHNQDTKIKNDLYADTYTNPNEAYKEAQKVLLFISNTMNGESSSLKHISEIDKSLKHCNELSIIDNTINSVKK
jgi:hypothetical protein